jgi:hypothetical protein
MNQISDGEGYLERTFLSPASIRATAVIVSWMKDAGLTTYVCLCFQLFFHTSISTYLSLFNVKVG